MSKEAHPTIEAIGVLRAMFHPEKDKEVKEEALRKLLQAFASLVKDLDSPDITFTEVPVVRIGEPALCQWWLHMKGCPPCWFEVEDSLLKGPWFDVEILFPPKPFCTLIGWDEDRDSLPWGALATFTRAVVTMAEDFRGRGPQDV